MDLITHSHATLRSLDSDCLMSVQYQQDIGELHAALG
jgi:hypothetical protein